MLVVYPRLMSGTATSWKCRACDQYWSDAQTIPVSYTHLTLPTIYSV